jgi:hypothetical protein
MGNRFFNERGGDHVSFSEKWPGVGIGRFWKRQLSKARRRHVKAELIFAAVEVKNQLTMKVWLIIKRGKELN